MKTLTAPQTALIGSIIKNNYTPVDAKNFDKRVISALLRAGLVQTDGATVALTEEGKGLKFSDLLHKPKAAKAKKASKRAAKGEKKARATPASKLPGVKCYCGCGHTTKNATRLFLQGHDARLRSHYLAVTRGEKDKATIPTDREEVMQYLAKDAHWMTKKLADAFAEAK